MVYASDAASIRAVFLGSMTSAWYEASDDDRRERILPRFAQLMTEWREIGARVLATLDDDLLMVGHPESTGNTFYVIVQIDDLDDIVHMVQRIRETVDGVRLDTYMRWEARIGRPFFLLEPS